MPFKSKSQRRLFYAKKARGEMDQKTIDEWESETPDNLPEKVAFWAGFEKRADSIGGGGRGHSGTGKGQLTGGGELTLASGTLDTGTKDSHDTLDRDRTARDFSPNNIDGGPVREDENGSHVLY